MKCGIRIQLSRMRQHIQDCGGGSSASASTSSENGPDKLDFSGSSTGNSIKSKLRK